MTIEHKIYSVSHLPKEHYNTVDLARQNLFGDATTSHLILSQETDDTILRIKNIAERIREEFKSLVIIGAGASINIPKMLHFFSREQLQNVYFVKRVDARNLNSIFEKCNQKDTCVITISKSGNTTETNILLTKFIQWFNLVLTDSQLKTHLYFITEPDSKLDQFAHDIKATSIHHPVNIGGRFSSFNTTGLLPAAIFGFNLERFISAGKNAFSSFIKKDSWVIEGVLFNYVMSKQYPQSVLVKYESVFDGALVWLRQLISESLGKNLRGFTPIVSDGMVDRHSQLQLYIDGPEDKFFTLFSFPSKAKVFDWEVKIDDVSNKLLSDKVSKMNTHQFNALQEQALLKTLCECKKNVRYFLMHSVTEETVAEFIMGQVLEVMLYAYLQGIDPFGQPAVEKFKKQLINIG